MNCGRVLKFAQGQSRMVCRCGRTACRVRSIKSSWLSSRTLGTNNSSSGSSSDHSNQIQESVSNGPGPTSGYNFSEAHNSERSSTGPDTLVDHNIPPLNPLPQPPMAHAPIIPPVLPITDNHHPLNSPFPDTDHVGVSVGGVGVNVDITAGPNLNNTNDLKNMVRAQIPQQSPQSFLSETGPISGVSSDEPEEEEQGEQDPSGSSRRLSGLSNLPYFSPELNVPY